MNGKPEKLICDTSFVGHLSRVMWRPDRYEGWGGAVIERVLNGDPAVSIVTIAESYAGYLKVGWGGRRLAEAERQFDRFRRLSLEWGLTEEWARLRVATRIRGIAISDNDLWIAATASALKHALVTCDRDHQRIAPDLKVEVLFVAPPV